MKIFYWKSHYRSEGESREKKWKYFSQTQLNFQPLGALTTERNFSLLIPKNFVEEISSKKTVVRVRKKGVERTEMSRNLNFVIPLRFYGPRFSRLSTAGCCKSLFFIPIQIELELSWVSFSNIHHKFAFKMEVYFVAIRRKENHPRGISSTIFN